MRGVRGGVETLVREKNPNLFNVSGDTVHMVNNVAKTLMNCVDQTVTAFASDLFYDIEESPKVQEIFAKIQSLINECGKTKTSDTADISHKCCDFNIIIYITFHKISNLVNLNNMKWNL
jgi:hypothetical protein